MVGNLLVKPKTALQNPTSAVSSQASAMGSPTNTFSAGLSMQTLLEIQRKALSNTAMSSPDAVKDALYGYYQSNPGAKITGGMEASMLNEIQKKATGGIAMSAPSAEKNAIYNALKPPGQTQQPQSYANVSQFLGGGANQQPTRDANGTVGPTNNGFTNWNSNQSIPDYGAMTPDMIQKILSGYTDGNQYYDPSKDPVYNSMLELSGKQADKAGLATMEEMNARGILNSTVTSDRVGQIKQGASDAVLGAIPGLAANFSNQQSNNQAGMQNLLNSVLGAGQFQQGFAEDNRRFDKGFSLDEAAVTGRYMSPEAQKALDSVLNAKKATSMNISPEDKQIAVQQAEQGRQLLASLGFDISGLGANTNYDQALNNSYYLGRDSLPQQQMDLSRTEVMGKQSSTVAQGLIQQVLAAKQANEKGATGAARTGNAQVANDARAKLQAMGFDVSGIAGNVKYDQAVKNANKLGSPTLAAVNSAAERDLSRQKLASDEAMFGREMNFKEQSFYIESDLKSRGLDLEEVKLSINAFAAESDADYKQYQKSLGISDQNAKKNTNDAVGEIMKTKSAGEALDYFLEFADDMKNAGVDNRAVLNALEKRFPGALKELQGSGGGSGGGGGRYDGIP